MDEEVRNEIARMKSDIKKLREDLDKHFERHLRALERRKQEAKK